MSTLIKDLGAVSAYAYAVEKGYTGTEDEFASLMYDYTDVIQIASEARDGAVAANASAQEAKTEAQTASNTANEAANKATSKASEASASVTEAGKVTNAAVAAKTAAETAQQRAETAQQASEDAQRKAEIAKSEAQENATIANSKASKASQYATTATNKASEASTSAKNAKTYSEQSQASATTANTKADEASASANSANTSEQTASQKALEAAQSASTAVQAKTYAESAKTASQTAQGLAEQARNGAVTAKTDAESARDAAAQSASEAAESARTLMIDTTLTKEGQAADAKAVGDAIAATNDFVDIDESYNIFNPKTITPGYVVNNSGSHDSATYYAVSDYIPVSTGDVIRATPFSDNTSTTFQLYNSSKTWVTGTRWTQTAYEGYLEITIPNGISYVTVNLRGKNSNNVVVTKNTAFDASYGGTYGKAIGLSGAVYKGKLYGKKIAYNGDSICESRIVSGTANNGGAYAHLIYLATGSKYENRAISGGILASAVPSGQTMPVRSVVSDVVNMASDADLICFEGGINDYWKNVPLGDYSESDYTGTLDTTTVCGALESIFRQATNKWVGKPIVFIIVHKIKSTVYRSNNAGYTFAQEREKMIGICNKYAIPYYDAFAESGLNAHNDIQNTTFLTSNSTGNPDGCHPNESAYKRFYVPQLIALFESVMPRR